MLVGGGGGGGGGAYVAKGSALRGCKAYLLILHIYLKSLPKIFKTYSPRTFIISTTRVQSCVNSYIAGKRIPKERSYIAGSAFIEPFLYLSPMIDGFQYVWMNSIHVRRREKVHLLWDKRSFRVSTIIFKPYNG